MLNGQNKLPISTTMCHRTHYTQHCRAQRSAKSTDKHTGQKNVVGKALPERGRPRPRERLPKECSSEGWMEQSGTLAEPSDNSMPPYRTQETDPFGSASSFISSATIAVSFIFRQDAFPMPRQQRECLPQSVQPSSRVLHLQVWCQPRSQPHLPDDEGQIYN